jgi:aspartyl-tRNA(Asn)/glutamyl-tRNA(Gln) amidotransferase subunit A
MPRTCRLEHPDHLRMTRRAWLAAAAVPLSVPAMALARGAQGRSDITTLSLSDLRTKLRRGEISPLEATNAYLARIAAADGAIHAYVTVTSDQARRRAEGLKATSPGARGPLFGLPIAHKDLFETAGIRTTAGSKLFERHTPTRDATLVARVAAAGAITLGKTNTHELGGGVTTINPFFGTTRNPRDSDRIAGGSSGGSAAAVAARLAVAATGTDTGGSIRIPAALCGCVGFKPTYGLLSTAGMLGASPTFDHAGFLTRTVGDLVPLLAATMGVDAEDPGSVPAIALADQGPAMLRDVRIGVPRAFFFDDLDGEVARALDRALARLSRSGAIVREIRAPVDATTMARVFDPIVVAEIHHTYERDWRERPALFSEAFAGFFKAPLPTGLELAAAHRERRAFQTRFARLFDDVDVLATPTVPIVAPPIAGPVDGSVILRNTWPFNAAHAPALSMPCGPVDALPVGLHLAARPFSDAALLAIASAIERALG